jgi:hypothetical protein
MVAAPQGPHSEASRRAMIRTLYRWKSFWLGLFVLVFLGWAWVVSQTHPFVATWYPPAGHGVEARNAFNKVRIAWDKEFSFGSGPNLEGPGPGFNAWIHTYGFSDTPFVRPFEVFANDINGTGVAVAHWFLILLFRVPWSGWLVCRWRRLKSLETEVEPNP